MSATRGPKWAAPIVDYAGLAAFVGTYVVTRDLMTASWGLAIGSVVGLALGFITQKRLAPLPLITGVTAIIFATLTVVLHNDIFVKMKLTIVDGILAAVLLGGLAVGKLPLKMLLGEALKLSDAAWRKLSFRYAIFFLAVALINELIWRSAGEGQLITEGMWVAFRFPGVPILAVVFSLSQLPMMMKDMKENGALDAKEELEPPPAD